MRSEIQIGGRKIGDDQPVFIVAECGVTCNYDLEITKGLIDTVVDAGADAIKFIFWFVDEIFSDKNTMYPYETAEGPTERNMYDMMGELVFTIEEWKEVKQYADSKGVIVFSTVNSPSGITWSEEIGLEAYKLSSWDFNHHPLWRNIAKQGKPMIIDTGPVHMHELAKVLSIMEEEGNDQTILVHCFHTDKPEEMNMRSVPYLKQAFNAPVGYSATDGSYETDIMALSMGASFLEKRLTLDRNLPGHHHVLSLEPEEFKDYTKTMRTVQTMLGRGGLTPSPNDLSERKKWFRHLVANEDLQAGTVLTAEMMEGKRGEIDVSPEHQDFFIGRTLKRDLKENESITWDNV
jgi:N,N'-diacetyllegionaminate synthase